LRLSFAPVIVAPVGQLDLPDHQQNFKKQRSEVWLANVTQRLRIANW
jgi:hypothetical protein